MAEANWQDLGPTDDMERNVARVMASAELREGACQLAARAVELSRILLAHTEPAEHTPRGGRKAFRLEIERGGSVSNAQPALAGKAKA